MILKSLTGKILLDTKDEGNELLLQLEELNNNVGFLIKETTCKEYEATHPDQYMFFCVSDEDQD